MPSADLTLVDQPSSVAQWLEHLPQKLKVPGRRVESAMSHPYKPNAMKCVTGVYSYSLQFVCLLFYKSIEYINLSVC